LTHKVSLPRVVAAFILAWPLAAETVNFPMGTAGQVVLEYQAQSTRNPLFTRAVYTSIIRGSIVNQTKFPITCELTPKVGEHPLGLLLSPSPQKLGPGYSAIFETKNGMSDVNLASQTSILWEAHCYVALQYKFASPKLEQKFPGGSVSADIGTNQIEFVLFNDSDQPIEILWNDSSLISVDRTAGRIFHKGVKYADREQSLPNTTVPPQAKVDEMAIPAQNVQFEERRFSSGWETTPLLPSRWPVDTAEKLMNGLKGRKVVLFLQVMIAGKKVPVSLPFEVADVLASAQVANTEQSPTAGVPNSPTAPAPTANPMMELVTSNSEAAKASPAAAAALASVGHARSPQELAELVKKARPHCSRL
jgi:hypothetical protein